MPADNIAIPPHIFDVTQETGFMFNPNGGFGYRIRPKVASNNVETLGTAGGVAATVYGLRMARSETNTIRWFYSATNNAFSWPSGNFFDVSISNRIVFMGAQRNHLAFLTADGSWWVMTGVPGVNDTFRRISGGRLSPPWIAPNAATLLGDDNCYYLSPDNNYPVLFDGEKHQELNYLTMTPEDPRAGYGRAFTTAGVASYRAAVALQGSDNSSPLFVLPKTPTFNENGRLLMKHNGVWTKHKMETPVSYLWASNGRGRLFAVKHSAANDVWTDRAVVETDLTLNRPSFTTDLRTSPGDESNTPLSAEVIFPEQWSSNGDELLATEVMIDFIRWGTGTAETNRIQAEVTALARGSGGNSLVATRTWEQPSGESPATQAGREDRVRLNFGDQGSGAG
ncbi:MAG TPA: hypothetical protein VGW38_27210, partial [Chloroflexota bacterium]|nr:hypothetical protein [Chloroflexota bacterium]